LDPISQQHQSKKNLNDNILLSFDVNNKSTFKADCLLYSLDKTKGSKPITLLIDTGASQTAIVRDALEELGYSNFTKNSHRKQTAVGKKRFDITTISLLHLVGIYKRKNLEVEVLDWEDYSYHGIIGMDILSRLHFRSDSKIFELQSKPFQIPAIKLPNLKRGCKGVVLESPNQFTIMTDTEWIEGRFTGNVHSSQYSLEEARKTVTELQNKAENVVVASLDSKTSDTLLRLV